MIVTIVERKACWVDFTLEVELPDCTNCTETLDVAIEAAQNGEYEYVGCKVQDGLDHLDSEYRLGGIA